MSPITAATPSSTANPSAAASPSSTPARSFTAAPAAAGLSSTASTSTAASPSAAPTGARAEPEAGFVTFHAGGQSFSLDIAHVREIRRWSPVTPLPHAPPAVLGVMNLRGAVIPIHDLSACFGLGPTVDQPRNVVVVAQIGPRMLGLLVTAVSDILSVPRARIQDLPDAPGAAAAGLTGVILLAGGLSRVIDLAALLRRVGGGAA